MKRTLIIVLFAISYVIADDAAFAQEIKDVKPPVGLPENYFLLIAGLIILLLGIVGMIVRRFLQRIKKAKPAVILPPWLTAQEDLNQLKKEDLPNQGKIKEYYTRLSGIIRYYLEDQLEIRAVEMTTEEFFAYIKQKDILTEDQKKALKNFLDCCDMVKFAKYNSNFKEIEQSFALAARLIDETKERLQDSASVPKP